MNLRHFIRLIITGGDWANSLPKDSRRNLYWYWFDGLFAAASDTTPINYLTLYMLALGASAVEIGWFSALSSLAAALCLLPGAFIVEKYGRRKEFTVAMGGLLARILLLTMALAPFGLVGQALTWVVIGMAILRAAAGNLAFPAWMSLTGDIVPLEGRGRYFGSRNFVMIIAGIIVTYLIGEFITQVGSTEGYQLALGLSFATGMISTWFFSRIKETEKPKPAPEATQISLQDTWKDLRGAPLFLAFCGVSALWNFSHSIAGPFFNIYMAQDLTFTVAMIGIATNATNISKLITQPALGWLADHWGASRMQTISMFLIPSLPFMWLFASQLWHVIFINTLGGVFWGAFELASFNFLLHFMPEDKRARYSAIFQILVMLSMAAGAAAGSAIISTDWGYKGIFLGSGIGRTLAAILFFVLMRQMAKNR